MERLAFGRNMNPTRRFLRLPRTVEEAAQSGVLDRARRLLLYVADPSRRGDEGFTEQEVIIAGLLSMYDAQKARADNNAAQLGVIYGRIFAQRFRRALRNLAQEDEG